jgi:uncharacterized protein (DUF2147 family)
MKKLALLFIFLLTSLSADDILGTWKKLNDDNKPQCIISVYEYKGKCYGRIIATCNKNGVVDDSIYAPVGRAPGVIGNPFYAGLDLIWNLEDDGERYSGKIVDPEKGNIYNADVWVNDDGNLIIRGKMLIFGKNITWYPTTKDDFPKNFKMPNVNKFVPVIPEVD